MNSKTLALILAIAATCLLNSAQAQNRIGAGLGWGSEVSTGAVGVNGEFFLNKSIAVSPSLMFFFDDWWEVNGNGNFVFTGTDAVILYGIGGLNLTTADGNSELGVNLGIGSNFDLGGNIRPFAEAKYILGNLDQLVLFGGIKFPLRI